MPREFRITVPCQAGLPDKDVLKVRFLRTDLHAPKKFLGPYSNPDGEDNKLLKWTLIKTENGELLENAVKFFFDFKEDVAVFSFDPNKMKALGDKGFFEFELKGKYKFKDKIRINWEKDSLIKPVLHIEKGLYELGENNTRIGYIEVSPKTKDFAPTINVIVSLQGTPDSCLEVDRKDFTLTDGCPERIIVSINKQSFKHLPTKLIKEKIIFNVENTNSIEAVELSIGNEDQVKQTDGDKVALVETCHLFVSSNNEFVELFDEENPVIVYINQNPIIEELVLKTTLLETNASITTIPVCNDDNIIISSNEFGNSFSLKKTDRKIVRISIAPNNNASTICQLVKLEADYSLPCEKKIYVLTKEQQSPIGHLEFEYSHVDEDDNPEPYYIGSGREKIGTLRIVNERANNVCYKGISLPPTCDCPFVILEAQDKSREMVNGTEILYYEVFMNISESDIVETDDDDSLPMVFACDCLPIISRSLPIKNKEIEPISIEFVPDANVTYKQKDKILVGYLTVHYKKKESKKYINRNNRNLQTDQAGTLLISGKKKDSHFKVEDGKWPVYYNCVVKYGDKKNIDEIEHVKIDLSYSDSIEKQRMISFEFDIHPINAVPQPNVCVCCKKNKLTIWKNGILGIKEGWYYQFDSRARNVAQSAIIGSICFANEQTTPYKDSILIFKNVELYGKYLCVHHDTEFSIPNGSEQKIFSIHILYEGIPVADMVSTELHVKYEICLNNETIPMEDTIPITIIEKVTDDWYSLDLGTTGIVVAKWNAANPDETIPLELKDEDDPIEKETTIVSSKTILMDCEDEDGVVEDIAECVVRPNILQLKHKATFVLVPSKFLVGQSHIPFYKSYKLRYKKGVKIEKESILWDGIDPKLVLQHTYGKIFDMVENDCKNRIRKLIVTYPNTYTPSAITWLRNSIIPSGEGERSGRGLFPILTHGNLHFIPESDAVVAFYVNQEINKVTSMKDIENIIIYDMGAGTLDLSYVHIENRIIGDRTKRYATILKRIGIPIAGEFFSYLLYKQLEDKFGTSSMTTIKEWVDLLKNKFDTNNTYGDLNFNTSVFSDSKTNNEKMKIGPELERWISICSSEIFIQLLGKEWQSKVDKIVFSGRGSQFVPLRKKIEEQIGDKEKIDDQSIPANCLKQCVAKGALLYQRIFENTNMPFELVHKNTYLNLGIFHRVLSSLQREWQYDEIIGEKDYIWDVRPINGAYHAVVNAKEVPIDLSEDADIIFYLTPLSEDEMRQLVKDRDDCKWCFVNELFKFNPIFMDAEDSENRENASMTISIDENNQLSIVLNGTIDLLKHTTSPNIEDNRFFSLCNDYLNKKEYGSE